MGGWGGSEAGEQTPNRLGTHVEYRAQRKQTAYYYHLYLWKNSKKHCYTTTINTIIYFKHEFIKSTFDLGCGIDAKRLYL